MRVTHVPFAAGASRSQPAIFDVLSADSPEDYGICCAAQLLPLDPFLAAAEINWEQGGFAGNEPADDPEKP